MILDLYILTALGLNPKFSDHTIEADDRPLKGSTAPIVDLGMYELKNLNTGNITNGELFMNIYMEEINKYHIHYRRYKNNF